MRPAPDYPSSPYPFLAGGGLVPAARNNVVSIAMKYLGIPYKWGGARPKTGFDCSGLVQYVFAQLGIYLPHYAAAQYRAPGAVWVAPNRLQPGDLVFFTGSDGTRKAPGHVGIYVGDGFLIDAPRTGTLVRIDSLNEPWFANNYVGAKRILAASHDAGQLLHPSRGASAPVVQPILLELSGPASGESSGRNPVRTAAHASRSGGYGLWTGAGLGGILLLIAGAAVSAHRRSGPRADNSRRRFLLGSSG